MSSISSVSGFNPAAFLRGAGGSDQGPQGLGAPPKELQQKFQAQFEKAGKEAGVDTTQFAELGGKIQDALKNVDLSSSDDPKATIESTINSVLEENGVDPAKFKADFEKVTSKLPKPDFGSIGGGFGGVSASKGTYSSSSTQQDQLQKLIDQLFKSSDDSQNSQIASFFSQASAGTFLDAAA